MGQDASRAGRLIRIRLRALADFLA